MGSDQVDSLTAQDLERPGTVAVAISIASAGQLTFNLLPILLGSAAEALSLDNSQVGVLGSSYLAGAALVNFSAFVWVRRVDWRSTCALAGIVATLSLAGGGVATSYATLGLALFLAGCGAGVLFGIPIALFGDTRQPDRFYGLSIGVGILIGATTLVLLTMVETESLGFRGAIWGTAVVLALLCAPVLRMPRSGVDRVQESTPLARGTTRGAIRSVGRGLVALLLWFGALTALWVFVGRLGSAKGFDSIALARLVSVTLVATGGGSLLAALFGERFGRSGPLGLGALTFVLAAFLMWNTRSLVIYGVATCVYGAAWQLVVAYMMGLVVAADASGRLPVLNAAALGAGGRIGSRLGRDAVGRRELHGSVPPHRIGRARLGRTGCCDRPRRARTACSSLMGT